MPRAQRKDSYYQRSPYWLGHDKGKNGQRRSENYVIFWYDKERGRVLSISTGTIGLKTAREALDRHYLINFRGHHICISCGQHIAPEAGILVLRAIGDYLLGKESASSIGAIRPRLAHVVAYIASLPSPSVTCEDVDEKWVQGFRIWMKGRPIIATSGKEV